MRGPDEGRGPAGRDSETSYGGIVPPETPGRCLVVRGGGVRQTEVDEEPNQEEVSLVGDPGPQVPAEVVLF